MKSFLTKYLMHLALFILLLIVLCCPDTINSNTAQFISDSIDTHLLGNIGLYMEKKPFLSKVAGNYVAILAIVQGVIFYVYKSIPWEEKITISSFFVSIAFSLIGFYFTFFSNTLFEIPVKSDTSIQKPWWFLYWCALSVCFAASAFGISMMLYGISKIKTFLRLIQ